MKKEIIIGNKSIQYKLKINKRSHSIRISIQPDGEITVTVPVQASIPVTESFLLSKANWISKHLTKLESNPKTILSKNNKKDFILYKEEARILAETRLNHFNKYYNLTWTNITIRNQKTRWGSCSKKGTLSFNYKISLLSPELRDYIIVHELCHLGEFNHSSKFWSLVEKAIPNYKLLRKQIKQIE